MEEDLELLEKIKKGDIASFETLIEKYQKAVFNIIFKYTNNSEESKDMAQEVFIRVYKGISGFKGESKFFSWLYRVVVNVCLKYRENEAKHKNQIPIEDCTQKDTKLKTPCEISIQKEMQEFIQNAISKLPCDQKIALILTKFNGLSYEEASKILGTSIPALKSRLHRALLKMEELLRPHINDYLE